MPRRAGPLQCSHAQLQVTPSSHAAVVGYKQPLPQQRASAATTTSRQKKLSSRNDDAFAACLVLPGDDLALYPKHPPQSVLSWTRLKERNEVTNNRKTIYVASPPAIAEEVEFVSSWTQLQNEGQHGAKEVPPPDIDHMVDYLQAFCHGLPVKRFPPEDLEYVAWKAQRKCTKAMKSRYSQPSSIGLRSGDEATRIRTRPSKDNAYKAQLNLDDLLWAAIAMLPDDAYALLLLVEQDLYQSADDEFVCGMAAGGSRVAVVSMARYHPSLDTEMNVERQHAWPASHCKEYVRGLCAEEEGSAERPRKKAKTAVKSNPQSITTDSPSSSRPLGEPLTAAVKAHTSLPLPTTSAGLTGLWLGRVCRTASHELGHCFGIDHCVYYACNMQGSASIIEDARQAPYLCPVDQVVLVIGSLRNATSVDPSGDRRKAIAASRLIHLVFTLEDVPALHVLAQLILVPEFDSTLGFNPKHVGPSWQTRSPACYAETLGSTIQLYTAKHMLAVSCCSFTPNVSDHCGDSS